MRSSSLGSIRPTIGERNKRNPRDRSLNSDEQRMRAARLDGAQRPKKRRQPDLTQVAEEAAREECAAGATLSGAEEAAAAQEEADADADADADAQDPEVTGRPTRPESDRRKVFISVVEEKAVEIGKFYVPMQQAMLKVWSRYTDDELRLLLRFAKDGYKGVLEATEALKAVIDTPPEQRANLKLPPKSRR